MSQSGRSSDFPNLQQAQVNNAIEILTSMFGAVLEGETIQSIVNSCQGDITAATEMAMEITDDKKEQNDVGNVPSSTNSPPILSYAGISKATVLPCKNNRRITSKSQHKNEANSKDPSNSSKIEGITQLHQQGYRTLILMRGLPGSGKSTLARKVLEHTVGFNDSNYSMHVFSTDNYFCTKGYRYNVMDLSAAHAWNQECARNAMINGTSPVIIDNTNLELWEMQVYIELGVRNGYRIEILEPNTPWAKKPRICAERNKHGVDYHKLKRMLEKYTYSTVENLLKLFKMEQSQALQPTLFRNIPALPAVTTRNNELVNSGISTNNVVSCDDFNAQVDSSAQRQSTPDLIDLTMEIPSDFEIITDGKGNNNINNVNLPMPIEQPKCEVANMVEEFEKVSREWDKGFSWEDKEDTQKLDRKGSEPISPKPQRLISKSRDGSGSRKNGKITQGLSSPLETSNTEQNLWDSIRQSIPAWNTILDVVNDSVGVISITDCKDASTQFENISNVENCGYVNILNIESRDINADHVPSMVTTAMKRIVTRDSSSMTDEEFIPCVNAARHFNRMKNVLTHVDENTLKFYFENSQGNVNLAMANVLEGISKGEVPVLCETREETVCIEDDGMPCLCESMINATLHNAMDVSRDLPEEKSLSTPKKTKKDKKLDETSLQLKRHMEQNFVIPDKHYSPHCLKVRKMRRGEALVDSDKESKASGSGTTESPREDGSCCCDCHKEKEDSISEQEEEEEETINLTLGMDLIKILDSKYLGNSLPEYPNNIAPVINMPESLAQQIHALWLESLGYQIDVQSRFASMIMKEDEELARKLTIQELELEELGIEEPIPNLREIMDLELALSINREEMEKMKQKSPDDMASVMTKGKLYNLFPDMDHQCLDEMLMAHDGSFVETVSSLLVSTGREEIVLLKDGLNKFIMNAELQRQQKALEEERKNPSWLGEIEGASSPADMETVNEYRTLAQQCLDIRNDSYKKAMDYMQRGMNGVASYYSNVASLNTQRYEHANTLAATSLVEYHSRNNSNNTLDLHFLYVAEALQALDIFLDHHLSLLTSRRRIVRVFLIVGRGTHSRAGPRIKPAVMKRLKQRHLKWNLINPGLLSADLTTNHQLTNQLT